MRTGLKQYGMYSDDPSLLQFLEFIERYGLSHELHLNRTRVLVPDGKLLTEFLLRFPTAHYIANYASYGWIYGINTWKIYLHTLICVVAPSNV